MTPAGFDIVFDDHAAVKSIKAAIDCNVKQQQRASRQNDPFDQDELFPLSWRRLELNPIARRPCESNDGSKEPHEESLTGGHGAAPFLYNGTLCDGRSKIQQPSIWLQD
jgi:hypothetical protein